MILAVIDRNALGDIPINFSFQKKEYIIFSDNRMRKKANFYTPTGFLNKYTYIINETCSVIFPASNYNKKRCNITYLSSEMNVFP